MKLLDLPNEILLNICVFVRPDDVENLILVCRQLHLMAAKRLEQHYRLEKRFCHIIIEEEQNIFHKEFFHPIQVLREICKDSDIPYYIKYIDFTDLTSVKQIRLESVQRESVVSDCIDETSAAEGLMSASPYFKDPEFRESYRRGISDGEMSPAFAVLLSLLPNLSRLRLTINDWDHYIPGMLKRIVDVQAEEITNGLVDSLLSNHLKQLKVVDCNSIRDRVHFSELRMYGILPSVRTLAGIIVQMDSVMSEEPSNNIWGPFPDCPWTSNVKEIVLDRSFGTASVMADLLRPFKKLHTFKFYQNATFSAQSDDFDPLVGIKAIAETCYKTLRSLSLINSISNNINHIETMRNFEVLQELTISIEYILPRLDKSSRREMEDDSYDFAASTVRIPRLVDILPASLKLLNFRRYEEDAHEFLFRDFAKHRAEMLPNLTNITFDASISPCSRIRRCGRSRRPIPVRIETKVHPLVIKECQKAGVMLDIGTIRESTRCDYWRNDRHWGAFDGSGGVP